MNQTDQPAGLAVKPRLLIVDDNPVDRILLRRQIEAVYTVTEADCGEEALKQLAAEPEAFSAVILDLVMPRKDGIEVLSEIAANPTLQGMPVLVATSQADPATEEKCLSLGAWDFVYKPYDAGVILSRLKNMISRSEAGKSSTSSDKDMLTGVWNRNAFLRETRSYLTRNADAATMLVRIDLSQFRLLDSHSDAAEGDEFLRGVAKYLLQSVPDRTKIIVGRMDTDVFCVCTMDAPSVVERRLRNMIHAIGGGNGAYQLVPTIGIYRITDSTLSIETMLAYAAVASERCHGGPMQPFSYYDEKMTAELLAEQKVLNDAQHALDAGEFEVFLQPKYDLRNDMPHGAEALVRWRKGPTQIVPPGEFIPAFEHSGFIPKIDHYMWEHTCMLLHKWIAAGLDPVPVSVNISRANLYDETLPDTLTALVEKYQVPPRLLELELTESAYMDNPDLMRKTVNELHRRGFVILMDDFGSGYSSLNTLKDIDVDILKIDMKFLPAGDGNQKSERILASIIRMAAWLNLTVIVEGVETEFQKTFLESIGCTYVQGFYYARPMPAADYEKLIKDAAKVLIPPEEKARLDADLIGVILHANPKIARFFENVPQAAAICALSEGTVEPLLVNKTFQALTGYGADPKESTQRMRESLSAEDAEEVMEVFRRALRNHAHAECVYRRMDAAGTLRQIWMRAQYIQTVADGTVFLVVLTDMTQERMLETELEKYTAVVQNADKERSKLLVIDDSVLSRRLVGNVFRSRYEILEAENGEQGLALLKENANEVAAVLLDVVMPVMDGRHFMDAKSKLADTLDGVPVIVVSAVSSHKEMDEMTSLGVADYVSKPFIPQILERRVENAITNACFLHRKVNKKAT